MRFRFFHKLFIGFTLFGVILVIIAALGLSIIRSNNREMKLLLEQQVESLAQIALLQGQANDIRKQEAELTKISDYFAVIGNIENLSIHIGNFERQFFVFLKRPNIHRDVSSRLQAAWHLYRQDVKRTLVHMNNGELEAAKNVSAFSSNPRFSIFAENLEELTQLVRRQANELYTTSVAKQKKRQKLFLLLSALTFPLGIFLALLYAGSLAKRVDLLNREADRLAKGELDKPIRLLGGDELSELADCLDSMRISIGERENELQEAQATLEARVAERTLEYNRSNRQLRSEIDERIRVEAALRESQDRLQKAQRIAGLGSWEFDLEKMRIYFSGTLRELFQLEEKSIAADTNTILTRFVPVEDQETISSLIETIRLKGSFSPSECRIITPSGEMRHIWIEGEFVYDRNNRVKKVLGTILDITERKQMEEQLLRSQRVDSIGQLAGGIAHDFNNLLTSIVGNTHLAEVAVDELKRRRHLQGISKATERAKELAGKLLTFAKGGVQVAETLVLDTLIHETAKIALSGTSIVPQFDISQDLLPVDVNKGQIGQVLQNLMINARDAMPQGGKLIIGAKNVELDGRSAPALPPGRYNEISVTDTGIGIREEDLPYIFDLYFSMKERGADRGTGLGLAICHSIVKKHQGEIVVHSSIGHGTTFRFYLPVSSKTPVSVLPKANTLIHGQGRILVMDDEKIIQDVARNLLESLGYQVVPAGHGEEALALYQQAMAEGRPFNAVILDITIRGGMGGFETVRRLREIDPEVKAIVSSGYTDENHAEDYDQHGFSAAIPKPYKLAELSRILDNTIHSSSLPGTE